MVVSANPNDAAEQRSDNDPGALADVASHTLSQTPDSVIVAEITAHVVAQIAEWYGSTAQLVAPYPKQRAQRLSLILAYEVQLSEAKRVTLFVKIARRPYLKTLVEAISLERLKRLTQAEYAVLERISQIVAAAPAEERLAAIRPIAYLERWNALVMEEFPSTSLSKLLFGRRLAAARSVPSGELVQAFHQSGAWLQRFHQFGSESSLTPFDAPTMVQELQALIAKLSPIVQRPAALESIQAQLLGWCEKLDQQPTLVALAHGDYHLGNVLIGAGSQLAVIDLDQCSRKPIYADVANMLTDLTVRKEQVLSYGLLLSRSNQSRYERAFLRGYFVEQSEQTRAFVSLYCVWLVLRKWLSNELRFTTDSRLKQLLTTPIRWGMRRYFLRLIADYLSMQRPVRS